MLTPAIRHQFCTSAVGDSHVLPPALTCASPRRPFVPWNSCAGCWNGEDPKKIVICDGCDVEYHTYCLTPPLDEVGGPSPNAIPLCGTL